ncbi:DoxX family protein [Nonomuraea rubra]|uniref:Thiosulfate dehydrogenase [quinone] large subunit n=2 Tax=Nonomuraea rubra TaxID=46180 RepID=A0A7X0NV85_9ACTN|nr:DoxX family protein [Nonomuraea rubra]MBB6550084.1 thiosulfate dehydrogenase [quinone] large subunit [Nonomuraea rubra]
MATTIHQPVTHTSVARAEHKTPADYVWAIARISIGWVFLWAFLDKTFGFGFATPAAKAWINGGSPTTGFLKGTGEHALGGFFTGLAGQVWVDWLFMAGLAGVGLALVLGIGTRIAAGAGTAMLLLMWAAELPLTTNPFMDDHLIYAIVLIGLALTGAGTTLGLGNLPIVQRTAWLK